jgi:hypothetical protein
MRKICDINILEGVALYKWAVLAAKSFCSGRSALLLLLPLLFFSACTGEEEELKGGLPPHAWIEIDQRIAAFEERKERECTEKAVRKALERVDSTLLGMKVLIPIDTTGGVIRPVRPRRPSLREGKDTTPVKPFIEFQSEENNL